MSRQLGVMFVYLTRPLCWVLFAVIATFSVVGWSARNEEYATYVHVGFSNPLSSVSSFRKRVNSLDSLTKAFENPDARGVDLHYGLLARDFQFNNLKTNDAGIRYHEPVTEEQVEEHLKKLTFPPLTQTLTTDSWEVRQSTIEQIGNLSSLEHVEFLIPKSQSTPLDLSPFTKLANLKSLNLGQIIKFDSLAPLQALPKLESLAIGNHQCVTAKNLRDVAAIKSLRRLFLPDVTNNPVAMAALSELQSPSLTQVYVAIPPAETDKLQAVSGNIPGRQARPSKYLPMRAWGCGVILGAMLMINLLGIHFAAMFSVPAAELTPGYRVTQRRVAWTVMLTLVMWGACGMWICKVNFWLAVLLPASALFASVTMPTGLQMRNQPAGSKAHLFGLLVLAAIISVIGWATQHPLELDYFLARPPWWAVGLLSLLAVFLAARWNGTLSTMCRDQIASGNDPILSFSDMQEATGKLNAQRLGNQTGPYERMTNWLFAAGLFLLLFVLVHQYAPAFWFTPLIDSILLSYLPMLAFWAYMFVLIKWWSRVPFLATMITRPPSRHSQIRKIFLGVATDFARAGPLLLAVVFVIGSGVVDQFGSAVETALVTCLLAAGFGGMSYALTLAALTVRSPLWIIVTCFSRSLSLVFSVGWSFTLPWKARSGFSNSIRLSP